MTVKLSHIALHSNKPDTSGTQKPADIISFIQSNWGLGLNLYPVQRVILKAHYGIPLDDNLYGFDLNHPIPESHPNYDPALVNASGYYINRVRICDWRMTNIKYVSEAEYLRYLFDNGRCNIHTVIPGQERREMVLSVGRRSGKCVTGDTLVLTDKGVFPIKELGDPDGPEIQPLDVGVAQEGRNTQARSAYFYNGGIRDTKKVTTHCGYSIEGTPNHRVKVLGSDGCVRWAYLDDIKPGDHVAIHRSTNLWASSYLNISHLKNETGRKTLNFPEFLTSDWGYLIGLLVGDGCWTLQNRVEVSTGSVEYRDLVMGVFESLLGDSKYRPDLRTKTTGQVQSNSVAWRKFLQDLGWICDVQSDNKEIPWSILRSPKDVVTSFLRGIFDSDGGMEANNQIVSWCSASKRLAQQVQILLLNLGIVSRMRVKPNKKYQRNYYSLTIRGLRSRQSFAREVGFALKSKSDGLMSGLENPSREGGNTESIPCLKTWSQRLLASVPKRHTGEGWGRSALRLLLGNTIKNCKEEMTYSRLERVLTASKDLEADPSVIQHLQDLSDLDYFYDPVVSVEDGHAHVYDLNVPEGHEFVANGMTNHNTLITSCIVAYETYKLLLKHNPQKFYGSSQSNVIQLISVATGRDQAGLLFREAKGHFSNCQFFKKYMANETMGYASFQTPFDIEQYGSYSENQKARYSIKVTFESCIAKSLRGGANILVALDEMAHFTDEGQSSADDVYQAVEPSIRTFSPKDPKDPSSPIGENEGRIIMISSPLGKQGLFYKQFMIGFTGGLAAQNMLSIEAPTWEVNPTIPAGTFENSYLKDPRVFLTEFGAQFTDKTASWIADNNDLLDCVQPDAKPRYKGLPRVPHFVGIDVGLVNDYTAIAIGHLDEQNRIVLDLIDSIKAGEGTHEGVERLEFTDVVEWIYSKSKDFYFKEGLFDQYSGIPLEQALQAHGLQQFNSYKPSPQINSQMFQTFKDFMFDKRLVLYDWPTEDGQHCQYITELLELQAEVKSKYVTSVYAPQMQGKHDDHADALVRMVWLASQQISAGPKYTTGVHKSGDVVIPGASRGVMAARQRARMSGSSPERMTPQSLARKSSNLLFKNPKTPTKRRK